MRIYLASSWRNPEQPELVELLRTSGHKVYDFRNPSSGGPVMQDTPREGFSWRQCDPGWADDADPRERYRRMLEHPVALRGFGADFSAMNWAEACVLALPCGRSAHLEAGWCAGMGRRLIVYLPRQERFEPELMYLVGGSAQSVIALTRDELLDGLRLGGRA